MSAPDADVVIAGAGPVGLTAALLLAARGIRVRVLEAAETLPDELRASTFHPPTLDLYEPHGITAELLAAGLICPTWQVRLHPSGERAVFDLSILRDDTNHPYRLQCEQSHLCAMLLARLRDRVTFGAAVVGVTQDDGHVTVELERAGARERLTARFVIGADGARSAVRRSLDVPFAGDTYPETVILVTTRFPFEAHIDGLSNVTYCWKPGGTFTLMRLKGVWRTSVYPPADQAIEDALAPDVLHAALSEIVPGVADFGILFARPYRVHQRLAARYRVGRVFLAGDAAHLNSPSGGMGMNGGIHDAFCLVDCLAAALDGADPVILDRYERQRRPAAEADIIRQAHQNRSRMQERDPAKRATALAELQRVAADPTERHRFLLRSSMIEGLRKAAEIA
jgi:2-polyprenyl-6-methoxyphenol hydroxylase-like FAD-dependent oxidoreductase